MTCFNIQNREVNAIENWVFGTLYLVLGPGGLVGDVGYPLGDMGSGIPHRISFIQYPRNNIFLRENNSGPNHPGFGKHRVSHIRYHLRSTILFIA